MVEQFAAELRELRVKAGNPGYRQLARRTHFSLTTLAEAAGGRRLPTLAVALAYVEACGGDREAWQARWLAAQAQLNGRGGVEDATSEPAIPAPYRGLAAYQPEDSAWFFGRSALVDDLLVRLRGRRFVAVFGASGSGKSSVLRAGVVAAARCGVLTGGTVCPVVVMTPTASPCRELAGHLASLTAWAATIRDDLAAPLDDLVPVVRRVLDGAPARAELLLVIDQFEELFTLCPDDERREFLALLLAGVRTPRCRLRVVVAVRADFYANCAEHPDLAAALTDAQVVVPAMAAAELREAVTRPAQRVGVTVDGALVATVVAEASGRIGALPLLSHALLEAWEHRRGRTLTLAAYTVTGGLAGAVTQTAERVYAELSASERELTRQILLRMVDVGADGQVTLRRVALDEIGDPQPDLAVVLNRLADARLILRHDGTVEIAHEALVRAWPRLRAWIDEDREGLRIHRQLTEASTSWEATGRDSGGLYRGVRLSQAVKWIDGNLDRLARRERRFLDASTSAVAAEVAARRRRRRLGVAGTAAISVVVAILAAVVVVQARRAQTERDAAIAGQLAANARAQLSIDPASALSLATQAYERQPNPDTESVLRQAVAEHRVRASTGGSHYLHMSVGGFTPDGSGLLITPVAADGDERPKTSIWTWASSDAPRPWSANPFTTRLAFSADGTSGVYGSGALYGTDGSIVEVSLAVGDTNAVVTATTGRVLAVTYGPAGPLALTEDNERDLWLREVRRPGRKIFLSGHRDRVRSAGMSADGRRVASVGEDGVRLW
ncbi:MAG TPA: AAA family ATPase, partial [Pilimelia sp.]|nr:AAA family ATPase [Pilimelia sp.]